MSVKVEKFNEGVYKKCSLAIDLCADMEDTFTEVLQAAYNNEFNRVYIDGEVKKELFAKIGQLAAYLSSITSNDEVECG